MKFSLKKHQVILILIIYLIFLIWLNFNGDNNLESDVKLYFSYAQKIFDGQIPYKDFNVVYPPLSLIFFILPYFFAKNFSSYRFAFGLETIIIFILTIWIISEFAKKINKNSIKTIIEFLIILFPISLLVIERYDIFPSFLVLLSFYLFYSKKYYLSAFTFACSFLTKLYPIIFLPFLFFYLLKKENTKIGINFGLTFVFSILAILSPFFLLSVGPSESYFYSFTYHLNRSLHIESFWGSLILLLQKTNLKIFQTKTIYPYGSWDLSSPLADNLSKISTPIILIFLILLLYYFLKEDFNEENSFEKLLRYNITSLLVFVSFNKVLSPQFLIWIIPLFVILSSKKEKFVLFLATLPTLIIYPIIYKNILEKSPFAISILFLRNILLVYLTFNFLSTTINSDFKIKDNLK
ncbi:MAG: glycosyltransferase 87 family protein [Candidatus Pacebacteria bacterium]|nr:glycosyltransferase 87 family protein [Candidatus Paceibacterota bacterium]